MHPYVVVSGDVTVVVGDISIRQLHYPLRRHLAGIFGLLQNRPCWRTSCGLSSKARLGSLQSASDVAVAVELDRLCPGLWQK